MKPRFLNPWLLSLLIFLSGLGLYYRSTQMSYFTDTHAKGELDLNIATSDLNSQKKANYYSQVEALTTNKRLFEDLGSGLVIVAVVLFAFLLWYRIKTFADFKKIRSPGKIVLYLLSNLAWLSVIPGTVWYYEFRLLRGDFAWFSDTIIIPIFGVIPYVFIGLIVMNIFIWVTSTRSTLPTPVFVQPDFRNKDKRTIEICWALLLLLNLYFFYEFVVDGDHFSIPVNMFFTYLILVLRAGNINRLNDLPDEDETTISTEEQLKIDL